jgi:catechol 2,3-dioxygenase-like lactoylglutathione lyase family enzyme
MLTAIVAVTLSAPDLDAAETAYAQQLHYRVVDRGAVGADLAAAWDAPLAQGRRYVVMQPDSGETTYLRIVQSPTTPGYEAMKTQGWNANEMLVQDVDALAAKLRSSAFKIVGEPRPLSSSASVRAMQVIGPAGELNYLTCIPPQGGTFIKTPAKSFVDRSFIAVVGGASLEAMRTFYQDQLGLTLTATYSAPINVLQQAWGWAADVNTRVALAQISPGFLIELDEYPANAPARPQRSGDLPPGMAMVSFAVNDLNRLKINWQVPPKVRPEAPYHGRSAGLVLGAAGEWIELIGSP